MKQQDIQQEFSLLVRDRNDEITALEELFIRSRTYRTSREYLDLLGFITRLPRLAPFNAVLVYIQNPDVKFVARAATWKREFARDVGRNARPLVVLKTFGPVDFVYDVRDTEGPPLPKEITNPFETKGTIGRSVYELTVANSEKDGIAIVEDDLTSNSAGYASVANHAFSVTINQNLGLNEKYSTLAHELGHIFAGHLGASEGSWWSDRSQALKAIRELEAESISYIVCRRQGLETSSDSYLAAYVSAHPETPPISFETVITVAGQIELMGKRLTRPPRKGHKKPT